MRGVGFFNVCLSQPGYSCVWDRVEFSAAFSGNRAELLLAGSERITSRTSEVFGKRVKLFGSVMIDRRECLTNYDVAKSQI